MPATQHDAVLWLSGSAYDVVFDEAHQAIAAVNDLATVAEETSSWPYRHDRDLTGFIDGSENPSLVEAPEVALIPEGQPGAGGTILLLQKWEHDTTAWESLSVEQQQTVMGRMKADSVEIEDKAPDSHVASTDQDEFGKVFRRNMPYGTVTKHGTMFVGFSAEQEPPAEDAGEHGRPEDRQTRFAHALHPAAHRRVLLCSFDGVSASAGRGQLKLRIGCHPERSEVACDRMQSKDLLSVIGIAASRANSRSLHSG